MERKADDVYERLAILQSESEVNKNQSEEEIQRLKKQIKETKQRYSFKFQMVINF